MCDETATGSSGSTDGRGHSRRGGREPAPLQSRAHFLKNRSWASVTAINCGLCERGRAQPGINSETHRTVAAEWEETRQQELTLAETFDLLRSCHRRAPFLFFNGNTFAEIGRALANTVFASMPLPRLKEGSSAVAHYITGTLDREMMVATLESLCQHASFQPGDKIRTLKGSLHGVSVKILDDGRVKWLAETGTEFLGLPESLVADD